MSEFTIKNSLVSFKSPAVTDITSAKVYFKPVQEGSGDPSPDNVRPITGWTEATLYKTGKNLLDPSKIKNQAGWNIIPIKVKPSTLYTCSSSRSGTTNTLDLYVYFKNVNSGGGPIDNSVSASHPVTVRSTSTGYVYLSQRIASGDKTFSDIWIQVELGSQATAYEPYNNGSAIPSEYQEVEYIEGNVGYSIIDTGIKGNSDSLIISGKTRYSAWYRYSPFYGNYLGEAYNVTRFITYTANDGRMIANVNRRASSSGVISCGFTPETDHVFTVSKANAIIDDVSYAYSGYTSGTENTTNIAINASRVDATPTGSTSKIRWYWFKIQNGDALLRKFIPCYRKSDSKPGMYDTVTNQFFASSGTEEFTAGPNVYYDTIPVSWENEAGTVYGGYVDLAKGEVVANLWNLTLQNASSTRYVSGAPSRLEICIDINSYGRANASTLNTVLSNMYPLKTSAMTDKYIVRYESEIDVYDSDFVDKETALSMLQDFICVYTLKVPITHQLTPETIKTLKGVNNIWGDTNSDTEITYKVADALKMTQIRKNILMSQPHVETVTSEGIATFKTDLAAPVKDCKVYFTPVQEGSGDPSPDNVRPISGWVEIEVKTAPLYRQWIDTGNNSEWKSGYYHNSGVVTSGSNYRYATEYIDVSNINSITFSFTNTTSYTSWYRIIEYDENKNKLAAISAYNDIATFTPVSGAKYIHLSCNIASLVILRSSNPTSITIPFPQTIYGGYVDLVKGEVVETWQKVILDGSQTPNNGTNYDGNLGTNRYFSIPSTGLGYSVGSGYCETAKFQRGSIWAAPDSHVGEFNINTAQLHVVFDNELLGISSDTSSADRTTIIKNWLTEHQMTFVVPLKTPITHQLTPETIKTLRGINSIWSNANGNIEVKFWKH